jgi:hypothetical protein
MAKESQISTGPEWGMATIQDEMGHLVQAGCQ